MLLLPLQTRRIQPGDDLAAILSGTAAIEPGDIVVLSSKAVATAEGFLHALADVTPSAEAHRLSALCTRSPAFCELVLQELQRMDGKILHHAPGALLTEVRPQGMQSGSLLIANAGLDESNVRQGFAIGWPMDPVRSLRELRLHIVKTLQKQSAISHQPSAKKMDANGWKLIAGSSPALVMTDSCIHPRRIGVGAVALAVSGLDPLQSEKGKKDLFGKELHITVEAVADQLATAANFLMGNAAQSTPAVIIRDHGLPLSDYEGWVPGMEPGEDLFPLFPS